MKTGTGKKLLIAGSPGQTENYMDAFRHLGADCESCFEAGPGTDRFDALVLPGGGDIDPQLFGEPELGSRNIDPVLDRTQLALLDAFVKTGRPVLGICKGMQVINVYFGGGIIQDLPNADFHCWKGQDQVHSTSAVPGSILHSVYGDFFQVNSAHHQAIRFPGNGLAVIQTASDGVPEAICHSSLPVLGVQWHPERMCFSRRRTDTVDGSLLLSFFLCFDREKLFVTAPAIPSQ